MLVLGRLGIAVELGFHGSFPCCPLGEIRLASLLLGFQRGLASGNLGGLRSG